MPAPNTIQSIRTVKTPQTSGGFTLLEILVVITIIGILAGLATLALGGNDRRELQHEAQRLHRLLTLATDEATFNHQNLGFQLQDNQYRFFRFNEDEDQWLALEQKPWQAYTLPAFARTSLQLEGEAGSLGSDSSESTNSTTATSQPSVMILASGELTPFRIDFTLEAESDTIAFIRSDGFNTPSITLGGTQ